MKKNPHYLAQQQVLRRQDPTRIPDPDLRGQRTGIKVGLSLGAAGVAAVLLAPGVDRIINGDPVLEAFSQSDVYHTTITEQMDPTDQQAIDKALESTGSGEIFKPRKVLLNDGTTVEVGIVRTGDNPTSIAHEIAPKLQDPTDITRMIAGQTGMDGNSTELQPGAVYVLPVARFE